MIVLQIVQLKKTILNSLFLMDNLVFIKFQKFHFFSFYNKKNLLNYPILYKFLGNEKFNIKKKYILKITKIVIKTCNTNKKNIK